MASPLSGLRRVALGSAIAIPLLFLLAPVAFSQNTKHHITVALGYEKLLSDDLKDDISGIDFTDAGYGALAYRLSLQPNLDLTLDLRGTVSTQTVGGVDLTLTNSFFGPGIRFISAKEGVRPYVQANVFLVDEEAEVAAGGVSVSASDSGAGFGISAGVDIRAGKLVSIPIEANFMYAKPSDDVSGIGANVGVTFNFGELK